MKKRIDKRSEVLNETFVNCSRFDAHANGPLPRSSPSRRALTDWLTRETNTHIEEIESQSRRLQVRGKIETWT